MAEPIFEGLPNAQDIVDRLSGAAVSKQQPHFAPPGPRPAPGRTEPRAGGPPYPTSEFPELAGPTGCHTPLCDPANLTYARTMIKHAWGSYMRYAKGADDLYPMQKGPRNWYSRNYPLLNTPIDSLDTLWLAGLKAEYEEARKLVDTFDPNAPVLVSFFETTIRQLGGLLSAYALTSDPGLLSKARDLADRLSGAFTESGAGLPMGQVNLRDGSAAPLGWMGGGLGLAEVGTFQLEFTYLARAVGGKEGRKYSARVEGANSQLMQLRKQLKVKGLYPFKIMPGISAAMGMSPSWVYEQNYKIGGGVDSFYEYLLKQWLLSGKDASESHLREAWDEAAVSIVAHLGRNVTKDGRVLTYFPDGPAGGGGSSLEHLACFMGGTLALGARTWEGKDAKGKAEQEKLFRWGEGFTKTCRDSYADQPTGIGPEVIDFSGPHLRPFPSSYARQYLLRPETVESIFYMWRLTHEQRYRDWAWQIMRAIQTWCATPDGYAGLSDVSTDGGIRIGTKERAKLEDPGEMDFSDAGLPHVDLQESFFIAETMKYLLLTFADDDLLPLDEWVFNTEAHPLPVARKGKHGKKAKKKKRKAENGSEAKAEAKAE
ncbi:hypothetical protein DFJ74DRAFT_665770 [Hyaloraphidium curvatum]|nr:hypothetical protein DFJ74DRAFT_665770 [Hyaloraphidium curvatum]